MSLVKPLIVVRQEPPFETQKTFSSRGAEVRSQWRSVVLHSALPKNEFIRSTHVSLSLTEFLQADADATDHFEASRRRAIWLPAGV